MPELHETLMGRKLIESTLPNIAKQLERIANSLEEKKESFSDVIELIKHIPNDADLGKIIRLLWQK